MFFNAPKKESTTSMASRIALAAFLSAQVVSAAPLYAYAGQMVQTLGNRQAINGACIFMCGDLVASVVEQRSAHASRLDADLCGRLGGAAAMGYVWGGTVLPYVYGLAEQLFPGRTLQTTLLKVAVSCGILSTVGNYGNLLCRRLLTGVEPLEAVASVNGDIAQVISHDLKVWPAYDLLCFGCIPPALRPLATTMMSTAWATYLSLMTAQCH